MIGLVLLRNHARVRQLAECFGIALESYRVGFDGLVQELAHECDYRAGVESSAQKRAERDVAHEVQLDALSQKGVEFVSIALFAALAITMVGKRQVPVAPDLYAIRIARQAATRWQCINALKHRLGRWHILQRKELAQTIDVQVSLRRRMLKNCFDLGREDEPPARLCEIYRLNSQAIAGHEEPPSARVP